MDDLEENITFFIYCYEGEKNNIARIETNNIVKNVKKIKEEKKDNDNYILYRLTLPNDYKGKPFALTLIDNKGNLFFKNIYSKEKFKYEMIFESFYKNEKKNCLNQKILSYKEQFIFYKNCFKDDDIILNELFINSINNIFKGQNKELDYKFLLFLFIEIFKEYKNNPNNLIKNTIKKYFKDLNYKLFQKKKYSDDLESIPKDNLDINPKDLEIISEEDTYKLRDELISITGNELGLNIKIDTFLAYYYIFYKPKLFMDFISTKKNKFEEIKKHLLLNKKVFNEFNSSIIGFDLLEEVDNLEPIKSLIKNFVPNILEFFKILSNDFFYIKLLFLVKSEKKLIHIKEICQPQKTDDMNEIYFYFDKVIDHFVRERNLPVYFDKDFFIEYCKLFLNESYEKIGIVHKMLKIFNINLHENSKIKIDKEINKYYHDTGIFLINEQTLKNKDLIDFLQNDPYLKEDENKIKIPYNLISQGIIFDDNDPTFTNNFFNDRFEDIDLKEFFGKYYNNFIKCVFDKFKKPKDLVPIRHWKISYDINDEVLQNFIYAVKRIWLGEPQNYMYSLEKLIANAFGNASFKMNNFLNIINELEKNISSEMLIRIYCELLYRDCPVSDEFKGHVINYIHNNCKKDAAVSLWYYVNTIDDEDDRNEYLENNLKKEYAVIPEDFINYPNITNDRIILFTSLYNGKYFFQNDITRLPYYTISIKSKSNIDNLKYRDAMNMYINIYSFQNLFLFFIPGRYTEENTFIVDSLLIDFSDKCGEAKKLHDSLDKIYQFWNTFYKNEKNNERNELKNEILEYENSSLKDCLKSSEKKQSFLKYLEEAEEGEKLKKSLFFMAIYNSNKDKFKNKDRELYNNSFTKFNKLKVLGIDSEINSLEKDLQKILIISVYENTDQLNDELDYLKSYFDFNPENYNTTKLKKSFAKLVKEYQKEKGENEDKKVNLILSTENNKNELLIKNNNNNNIIKKNNGDEIEDDINFEYARQSSELQIKEEKNQLIKKIENMRDEYFLLEKQFIDINNINENNQSRHIFYTQFINFFKEIFNINYGFGKLDENEFKNKILLSSKKIYINGVGVGLMNSNMEFEKSLILISEFYDIMEVFKNNLSENDNEYKDFFIPLLEILKDCLNSQDLDEKKAYINIEKLFFLLNNNLKHIKNEILYNLIIQLLIKEKKKYRNIMNEKLIKLIFKKEGQKFIFLKKDIMPIPLIDEIFSDYFKLSFDDDNKDNRNRNIQITDKNFESIKLFETINEICRDKDKKIFEEMLLFYLETKIMVQFNKQYNNKNEQNLFENERIKKYLELFLLKLGKGSLDTNNKPGGTILKLYCIAFIKCFLNKMVNFSFQNKQQIKSIKSIVNDIIKKGNYNDKLKTSIKIYILKIFFDNIGNYYDFRNYNFTEHEIEYIEDKDIELIINQKEGESLSKAYGFDYMIIPNKKSNKKYFAFVIEKLMKIKKNNNENEVYDEKEDLGKKEDDQDLMNIINKTKNGNNDIDKDDDIDIDLLYCGLLNIHFSFYYFPKYFLDNNVNNDINNKKFNNINNWILNKIEKKEFTLMEKNEILEKIFLLFANKDNYYEKIVSDLSNEKVSSLSYNQLLCVLISARFVLRTIYNNKITNGLYYNLVSNPKSVINNNENFFKYYFKHIALFSQEQREISFLTYRIINYIIISHLYFGFLLGNIKLDDNKLKSLFKKENNENDNNKDNYLFQLLIKEFDYIRLNILNLIGIKKIIIFMNSIFEEVSSIIINIKTNDDYKSKESDIDSVIKNKLLYFDEYTEDYYKTLTLFQKNDNIIKDIFLENYDFYNNKKENPDLKFPFISYLTSTNFCSFDDFRRQRLFLINDENETKSYPMIDNILRNNNLVDIIGILPKINSFINEIYNKLLLRISEDDINKDIKSFINLNIDKDLFTKSLPGLLKKYKEYKINLKINENCQIKDVINIKDNDIFKLYNLIIEEYNQFLSSIKFYKFDKEQIQPNRIIIQNASEKDYNLFQIYKTKQVNNVNNNNNLNTISAKDRLCEILYLYSNRNRVKKSIIKNNEDNVIYRINVADGGKIIYDYDLIENMLEKEFLLGKKLFLSKQKTFIFSNNVFSDERNNILIKLNENEKNPQKEIEKENMRYIEDFLDNNQDELKDIYYNLQYIIIYLMEYEKESTYNCQTMRIEYIINIIEKGNFKMNEQLKQFMNISSLLINNLLSFYEIIELKVFNNLTQDLKVKINKNKLEINIKEETKNIINKNLKNNMFINEEILTNGIKKYILRYCLGDNKNSNNILDKFNKNFGDIFNRSDIFRKISNDARFKSESKNLININKDGNCVLKYFYNILFSDKAEEKEQKEKIEQKEQKEQKDEDIFANIDNEDDDKDEEQINEPNKVDEDSENSED